MGVGGGGVAGFKPGVPAAGYQSPSQGGLGVCVCVCVCEKERERERGKKQIIEDVCVTCETRVRHV